MPVKSKIEKFLYSYRRTVQSSTNKSPAEMMFNRNFKSALDKIKPKYSRQEDCSLNSENKFVVGDLVFAKNYSNGDWVEAVVTKVFASRNYLVKVPSCGNKVWKRHYSQLISRSITFNKDKEKPLPKALVYPSPSQFTPVESSSTDLHLRRSTRISRPPDRLNL